MSEPTVCTVTLEPEGTSCEVPVGTTLQEAAARLGIDLSVPCGGEGTCGKCRVQVVDGGVEGLLPEERALLSPEQIEAGLRLGCRAHLTGASRISVPAASRTSAIRVLPGGSRRQIELSPWVRKQVVDLEAQTLEGAHSRLEHLRQCGDLRADLKVDAELLRRLPDLIHYDVDQVTAVIGDGHLLEVEAGDTADACYGLALDLGTTTVVANLVDLNTGKTVGHGVTGNRQSSEGHDVITRIRLGLIPPLPVDKLHYIGNGALMGANLSLLSRALRRRGQQIAGQAEYLQIAGTPDFQMRFSEAMLFELEAR